MVTTAASAAALQILNNALSLMKAVRERTQRSKDSDLKGLVSTLFDSVLSLKESVMLVTDENNELRRRITELERPAAQPEPELKQVGVSNFYFVADKGPYCQPCYDGKGKLTMLTPQENWSGGVRRQCVLCGGYFYEKAQDNSPVRLGGRHDPQGWME